MFPADAVQRLQLRFGIDGAHLGGLRNIYHPRLDHMGRRGMLPEHLQHPFGAHLALRVGNDQHLVAGRFYRAGLVDKKVAGFGAQHRLVRAQGGRRGDEIGLGAAGKEPDIGLGAPDLPPDEFPCFLAVGVKAVAGGLLTVGLGQGLQNAFVAALAVIVDKQGHWYFLSESDIGGMQKTRRLPAISEFLILRLRRRDGNDPSAARSAR